MFWPSRNKRGQRRRDEKKKKKAPKAPTIRILKVDVRAVVTALTSGEPLRQAGIPQFPNDFLREAIGEKISGLSPRDVQKYLFPSHREVAREIRSLRDRIFAENTRDGARVRGRDGKFVPTEEFRLRARALNRLFDEFCRSPRKAA